MLRKTGELDRILDGHGLTFDSPPPPAVPVSQPFYIPPFDTSSFVDTPKPAPELEPEIPADPPPTYPAPPKKRRLFARDT